MLYSILRNVLFQLDAETAHNLGLSGMNVAEKLGVLSLIKPSVAVKKRSVMGIEFPNPVGLAAGLDKDGEAIDALAALGFGFLELGTVTPRPQPGNPKPRLFRLKSEGGIINRMGFNNKGIDHLIGQIEKAKCNTVIGINIGKNVDTPLENAVEDYLICLRKAYAYASYIAVNISSPNTKGLRDLQSGDDFTRLLASLKNEQLKLQTTHGNYVPIAVKIAPDLTDEQVAYIAIQLVEQQMDGVIATNTTIARDAVAHHPHASETGGLSGKPLKPKADALLAKLANVLEGRLPIIGVGGIFSGEDAQDKFNLGAQLVQIYSGFIYRGPELIGAICQNLKY